MQTTIVHQLVRVTAVRWAAATMLALVAAVGLTAQAPARSESVQTSHIFEALMLKPGQTVAEIGAGDGELTMAAAKIVGESGKVFTSELGDNRVSALQRAVQRSGLSYVTVVAGDPLRTNLPDSCCDAIFMRNVYHHFADPASMNASLFQALKPGGRIAISDFAPNRGRPEAARPADRGGNRNHGVMGETIARELTAAGFEHVTVDPGSGRWFIVSASKPSP